MQFTKEHLIWCAQERIGAAREIAEATPSPAERSACEVSIALLENALATLTAKPFMYGIADPDGGPHFAEFCVSGNLQHIEKEVETLNAIDEIDVNCEPHYRVAPLYRLPEMK
jgi:hypothetical protein